MKYAQQYKDANEAHIQHHHPHHCCLLSIYIHGSVSYVLTRRSVSLLQAWSGCLLQAVGYVNYVISTSEILGQMAHFFLLYCRVFCFKCCNPPASLRWLGVERLVYLWFFGAELWISEEIIPSREYMLWKCCHFALFDSVVEILIPEYSGEGNTTLPWIEFNTSRFLERLFSLVSLSSTFRDIPLLGITCENVATLPCCFTLM